MRFEDQYLDLMTDVINYGQKRPDRTGVGTRSQFGRMLTADLSREFPILITKPVAWKTCLKELLWMISGSTNVRPLQEQGVHIWDAWADEDGELGPVYGEQWRSVYTPRISERQDAESTYLTRYYVDQLADVITSLRDDPFSRRHVVSSWNVGILDHMRLPPCHYAFQFYVDQTEPVGSSIPGLTSQLRLSCFVTMRSADLPVGVPFNVVAYATLTLMICRHLGYAPGELKLSLADAHVYENQIELAIAQETRRRNNALAYAPYPGWASICSDYLDRQTAKSAFGAQMQAQGLAYPPYAPGPKLIIKPSFQSVLTAKIDDFDVIDYHPIEPRIDYPVAV
jgi:thymidylate synthase